MEAKFFNQKRLQIRKGTKSVPVKYTKLKSFCRKNVTIDDLMPKLFCINLTVLEWLNTILCDIVAIRAQ